jgi:hypothetical protein
LNCNALPYLPDAAQVAFVIVPLLPLRVGDGRPRPLIKPVYAATNPDGAAIAGSDDAIASATWNGGLEQLWAKNLPTAGNLTPIATSSTTPQDSTPQPPNLLTYL